MSDRQLLALIGRVAILERERRQYWPVTPLGGASSKDIHAVWVIQGGNTLVAPPVTGIKYSATNVSAASLPIPTIIPAPAPGSTVDVDASNPPAGLPDGVGIARAVGANVFAFVLNDNRRTVLYDPVDLRTGNQVYAVDTIQLSVASGGVTYRYTLLLPEARN